MRKLSGELWDHFLTIDKNEVHRIFGMSCPETIAIDMTDTLYDRIISLQKVAEEHRLTELAFYSSTIRYPDDSKLTLYDIDGNIIKHSTYIDFNDVVFDTFDPVGFRVSLERFYSCCIFVEVVYTNAWTSYSFEYRVLL